MIQYLIMLDKLRKDIDGDLKDLLKYIKDKYRLHRTSPLLFNGIKDFFLRKGKRIRPALLIISYLGYTKRKDYSYKKLLRCSLSLELLHNFMLVHDDVIDNSDLRRGKPTLHRLFNTMYGTGRKDDLGSHLSVVAGDIIFALAIEVFLSFDENLSRKERALIKFAETTAFTGTGEFLDVLEGRREIEKIKEKDVYLNYTLKTAKYTFEGPLLMGAMLAGAGEKELEKLSAIGLALGRAFQIQDDLLDMFATSKEIGKPVLSDLSESKKTLLVWKAYNALGKKDRQEFKRFLEKDKKTQADLLKFRKLVKKSGAHLYCMEKVESLFRKADSICDGLSMKTRPKKAFKKFLRDFFSKSQNLKSRL